jgi:transcriptional regulator with AAA-type ATPase domain/polyferredoxin
MMPPGDNGDLIRFLMSGEASVMIRDGDDPALSVESLQPGDIFGEISFLTGRPTPSNSELVADEPCNVLEISAEEFEEILRQNPDFTVTLVKNLARKIMRLDRTVFRSKQKKRALQSLISREEHIFPDYVIGDFVRSHLAAKVESLAHSEGPVLIIGETGVGKEVLAHAIFRMSHHYKAVFLLLDLLRTRYEQTFNPSRPSGADDEKDPLAEQMRLFFGSEEPTSDGGSKVQPGYVELTEDGTLLVRGIEQLTPEVQDQLLEAMCGEGTYVRFSGKDPHLARVRLIATTELDPSEISRKKHPLLHSLMQRSIVIPPLRKRRREIPGLVKHYINQYCQELRKDIVEVPKETLKTLVTYSWPGNDIELSTTLKRAVLVSEGGVLRPQDIYFDLKRVEGAGKFNLLRFQAVRQALASPLFPAIFQSAVTPFFFILLVLLFLGPQDPLRNPAALFSWAVGWPVLICGAFIWARFWCSLCPIGTLSKLAKKIISLERPFPTWLKNRSDLLIAGAVLCIIWFETATGIRDSPMNVGLLLLTMLASAVTVAVIFERQSWCRYVCGLGGMISVLSKASFIELRADRNVCISQCSSNECYLGTANSEGCPFGQVAPKLHSNRFCKLCGVCVKNCPHGAVNLNLRVPGREIWEMRHTNTGTAFLIIGMIGGLLSEMAVKMPLYAQLTAYLPLPEILRFTVIFFVVLFTANLMFAVATVFSRRIFEESFQENYSRYGLALLPMALTGFMAYHLYYLINLGVQLPILVSKNFDFAIFRTLIITVPPSVTHFLQQLLIWIGFAWSTMIIYKLGRASHEKFSVAIYGIIPHAASALVLTICLLESVRFFFYGN